MNIRFTRHINQHRSVPVRDAVVVCCKNADYCAPPRLRIMTTHVDTGQLSPDIISEIDVLALSSSRAIIQIPIVRRPH
jgi:hypothetical protein